MGNTLTSCKNQIDIIILVLFAKDLSKLCEHEFKNYLG